MNDELIIPADAGETLDIYLSPTTYPVAFERKIRCLMNSGLSKEEAEAVLLTSPIQVEIFYDIDRGLFAIESEPIGYIPVFNPFTGEELKKEEEEEDENEE
jgi:hypothetical protein